MTYPQPFQEQGSQSCSNQLHRRPFYSVARSAYLHVGPPDPEAKNGESEEAVRQWCAFELMRAYGFSVNDLNFESQVRVGSKSYRIDILVLRNGTPWIVVECKAPDAKNNKAIEQAISYADSPRIQAEYVLYTNGSDWLVRRRLKGQWISVLDLPSTRFDMSGGIDITHFYSCFSDVAPLLFKLDEALEGKDAECFLNALQKFCHGWNLLTDGVDGSLLDCADNLLRVITLPEAHPNYRREKYNHARASFCGFHTLHKVGFEVHPIAGEVPVYTGFQELQHSALSAMEGVSKDAGPNVLMLRFIVALLDYGVVAERRKKYFSTIPTMIHHSLREFLQYQFKVKFDAILPDPVDQISSSDFKLYCHSAWEDARKGVEQP